MNFEKIGETATISIQDLIPGTTEGLTGNMDAAQADQIQVYDPVTAEYTVYTLFYTTVPNPGLLAKNWKWVDVSGTVATYAFHDGDAFWYRKRGAGDLTVNFNGQVSQANSQAVEIVTGWNMIGSEFPANFNPNTLGTTFWQNSGAAGNMDAGQADQIQVYDPEAGEYTVYTLFYTTIPNPGLQAKNWKWVDVAGTVIPDAAEIIKPGFGVWYRHRGNGFTFNIANPLSE